MAFSGVGRAELLREAVGAGPAQGAHTRPRAASIAAGVDATGLSGLACLTAATGARFGTGRLSGSAALAHAGAAQAELGDPCADAMPAHALVGAARRDVAVAALRPGAVPAGWRVPVDAAAAQEKAFRANGTFARAYQRKAYATRPIACRGPSVTTEPPV
jgi:hypothetical protein